MATRISSIRTTQKVVHSGNFAAARVDLDGLREFVNPVVGLDHFWMSGQAFAPHPHAGFSAISYLFEDSEGGLRNRDSLGNDFVAEPGELIWTQAGNGVIHDELPAQPGRTVHGIQLFVNLTAENKSLDPQVFRLKSPAVPVVEDARGNRTRVLVGSLGDVKSELSPAEPFQLLDVSLRGLTKLDINAGWNTLIYVLGGRLRLGGGTEAEFLGKDQIIGLCSDEPLALDLMPLEPTHALVLSGPVIHEPMVTYGPFIMNSSDEISSAMGRFQSGGMGRLPHLH